MSRKSTDEKYPLTDTDKQLIELLTQDGAMSYALIGKAVGLSAAGAHERVKKLKEQGVILRVSAVVNPRKVERNFLCFVRLKLADVDKKGKADQLMQIPEIEEIHNIAGEFSIFVKVRARDTDHMEVIFGRIYSIDGVIQSETTVVFGTFLEGPMRFSRDPDEGE